jgi:integrase/recombinase XerD
MLQLRWANFDGTHLRIVIQKTNAQVAIKVPDKGLEILCRYRNANNSKGDLIFPVLPASLNLNDPIVLHRAIASATTQINRGLKILAKQAGITKQLSFHISRHSFAVMALRRGITIDKVSKLMAHSAIKETLVYAKIANEELDKAMDVFNV